MPWDITNSRARAGPARSAMRWVPPAPGVSPTTASTRPKRADSVAQIMSQPSEISSPAVRQRPWTRASVGIDRFSRRGTTGISEPNASPAAPSSTTRWKLCTSTPPVKMSPSARQTSARASDASTSSMQETSAPHASSPNRLSGGFSRIITATLRSRSGRMGSVILSSQSLGDLGDLVRVARLGDPGELQRIALVARHDMYVEMEDRLPGGCSAGIDQVDPVRAQHVLHPPRQPLRREGGGCEIVLADLEQVGRVLSRYHQRMTGRGRVDVHEGDGALVGVDRLARDRPRDDPAEEAVGVGHADGAYSPGARSAGERGRELRLAR